MDKQKRHELSPGEHAAELREKGELNFFREIDELARNEHTQTLAQLTGEKKSYGLLLMLFNEMERQKLQILNLTKEVARMKKGGS